MVSISQMADLHGTDGTTHSNTKVMSLFVIATEIALWAALKFLGKEITWPDVALLVSLVVGTQSVRALLAFWRGRTPGESLAK